MSLAILCGMLYMNSIDYRATILENNDIIDKKTSTIEQYKEVIKENALHNRELTKKYNESNIAEHNAKKYLKQLLSDINVLYEIVNFPVIDANNDAEMEMLEALYSKMKDDSILEEVMVFEIGPIERIEGDVYGFLCQTMEIKDPQSTLDKMNEWPPFSGLKLYSGRVDFSTAIPKYEIWLP